MAYSADDFVERKVDDLAEIQSLVDGWPTVWINVIGLGSEEVLRGLGDIFDLHRLTLEDIVNLGQRAKVEAHRDHLFMVARMAPAGDETETEQLSLLLGRKTVLTFQEHEGDCFDEVRTRIRGAGRVLRSSGADYLAYALLDAVIDAYFPVLGTIHDELEALEDEVLSAPERDTVHKIHDVKRRLQAIRRDLGPHREAVNSLLRESGGFVSDGTMVYLRDCYDHVLRVIERSDSDRELCSDLMNTYLSSVSNRMNEVMKVLTIIATIFIPLGFVAGLYGMNFNPAISAWNMPELNWVYGYPFALGLMALLGLGLVWFFWRKGWFD